MKLSTRSRYGTRMMIELARHYNQGPIQVGEIARRQSISVKYLEQLIILLKKAGLIASVRGPKGGHMIAKSPDKIFMGEVVRALEGSTALTRCVEEPESCARHATCPSRMLWERASKAMLDALDEVTLTDLMAGDDPTLAFDGPDGCTPAS